MDDRGLSSYSTPSKEQGSLRNLKETGLGPLNLSVGTLAVPQNDTLYDNQYQLFILPKCALDSLSIF